MSECVKAPCSDELSSSESLGVVVANNVAERQAKGAATVDFVQPELVHLNPKHAEHLLQVLRDAQKQEAERQRRLRHATSKKNLTYLQKR